MCSSNLSSLACNNKTYFFSFLKFILQWHQKTCQRKRPKANNATDVASSWTRDTFLKIELYFLSHELKQIKGSESPSRKDAVVDTLLSQFRSLQHCPMMLLTSKKPTPQTGSLAWHYEQLGETRWLRKPKLLERKESEDNGGNVAGWLEVCWNKRDTHTWFFLLLLFWVLSEVDEWGIGDYFHAGRKLQTNFVVYWQFLKFIDTYVSTLVILPLVSSKLELIFMFKRFYELDIVIYFYQ